MHIQWRIMVLMAVSMMAAEVRAADGQETAAAALPGIFEGHADLGNISHRGGVLYEGARKSYIVAGSGENMWFARDAFHFVW